MKVTKQRLKEIILEEANNILNENYVLERSGVPYNERFFQGGDADDERSFGPLESAKVYSTEEAAGQDKHASGFHLSVSPRQVDESSNSPDLQDRPVERPGTPMLQRIKT